MVITVHTYRPIEEPDVEEPVPVCYFSRAGTGDSRMVGAWLSSDVYEWVWDQYRWYTRISTGAPMGQMDNVVTGTPVPESESANIRSRYTVGKIEEPWNGGIQVHWICESPS